MFSESRKPSKLDIDIMIDVLGRNAHLSYRDAVYAVAGQRRMTPQGVYGIINRAKNDYRGVLALMKYRSKHLPEQTPAQREIAQIVQRGRGIDTQFRAFLKRDFRNKLATAVFVSDIHLPSADFPALELAYKVIEYLNPQVVSVDNDGLDLPSMSQHDEARRLDELWFDTDLSNAVSIYKDYLRSLRMVAPTALFPSIGSNHGKRVATMKDKQTGVNTLSDTVSAHVMEAFSQMGMIFLEPVAKENIYRVNSGLAWMHGITAASNPTTRVKKNFEYFQRTYPNELTDIVSGHTHRSGITKHADVMGVTLYESGCLCRRDMPYLAHGASWNSAIVVSRFDPNGRYHDTQVVNFTPAGSGYVCVLDGKTFSV